MTGKQVWIGTSWKMNKTFDEAHAFADGLTPEGDQRIQRFVIPPFTVLKMVTSLLEDSDVKVGAQNMHWNDAGAWTGEISPVMLKDCDAQIVELGHSERRAHFGETDETVGLKTAAAVRHGLIPLICIGETKADRDGGCADAVLATQVRGAFARLTGDQKDAQILLAYEPVWAIGAGGEPATPDYADARHAEIAQVARDCLGRDVPCLYGGSVNSDNCADLITQPHIDGLFIGRSAWAVDGYNNILARCAAVL
ncbi:triose-phosphate isomerase [Loktanella sp. DJP18]|uniref:triose-phosphate isomerase n=1 Tax=Loktanella sp. DJP18 TaxID=3409788 RepID=UPI003BB7CE59